MQTVRGGEGTDAASPPGSRPGPSLRVLVTLVVGHVCSEEGTAHILQLAF